MVVRSDRPLHAKAWTGSRSKGIRIPSSSRYAWTLLDQFVADPTWVPDNGSFLTTGTGSGDTKAAAGRSGTAAVAYFPSSRSVVVDTTVIAGTSPVRLRWYDPTTGSYTTIVGVRGPAGQPVGVLPIGASRRQQRLAARRRPGNADPAVPPDDDDDARRRRRTDDDDAATTTTTPPTTTTLRRPRPQSPDDDDDPPRRPPLDHDDDHVPPTTTTTVDDAWHRGSGAGVRAGRGRAGELGSVELGELPRCQPGR